MRIGLLVVVLAFFATMLVARPGLGQSIRCGDRIVSVGETAYELKQRCGPPDQTTVVRDFRVITVRSGDGVAVRRGVDEDVQILIYAGVSGDLLRIVEVRRGIVRSIRTGDRVTSRAQRGCGAATVLPRRATTGEIRLACGEPVDVSRWFEERAVQIGGQTFERQIEIERWVFDPGPGNLLRILQFENGRLVRTTTGRRSAAR